MMTKYLHIGSSTDTYDVPGDISIAGPFTVRKLQMTSLNCFFLSRCNVQSSISKAGSKEDKGFQLHQKKWGYLLLYCSFEPFQGTHEPQAADSHQLGRDGAIGMDLLAELDKETATT